ncbi:hypothetical protein [Anaeropeptidivorans aminofermentans]|jgi:hypothetical protein|uniref:hypothetical protein n=1 Tax=Anaeropeptidivorans aminofermentans TaxID=2934315 RepID=UPI00202592FD|nr:hypothetical protein [Anaeropeptidivorans aminofermentans]MBE6012139.1 hypothetical protein [Lachnospiraceae bacterium]
MNNVVSKFNDSKAELLKAFGCPDEYFIRYMKGFSYQITEDDGIFFLSYWQDEKNKTTAIVVKRDDKPLLYKHNNHTMVIAIDCVKIGFIFEKK